jgi:hypothetical protein
MSELELGQRTSIKILVNLGKSGSEVREMLVQVYGDNATKKTAVYKWVDVYMREIRMASNKQNRKKHCKSSSNCV